MATVDRNKPRSNSPLYLVTYVNSYVGDYQHAAAAFLHCCGNVVTVPPMNTATSPQDSVTVAPQVLAGRTLRMMREAHHASLRDVAAAAGVSPSHLSRVESGERPATADLTARLCAVIAELPTARESA